MIIVDRIRIKKVVVNRLHKTCGECVFLASVYENAIICDANHDYMVVVDAEETIKNSIPYNCPLVVEDTP